ncbi:MAG: alpha/beta hydrolase [Bacteroidota bacterium]
MKINKPNKFWLFTDGLRALLEWFSLFIYHLFKRYQKNGDGHPVLVIPGFMGSGFSTKLLRKFINKIGYHAYDWGLDRNLANFADVEFLEIKIDELFKKHGNKITLIGWSLGGVYARQLAKAKKEKIRQVITMGSPFNGANEPNNARWLYERVKAREGTPEIDPETLADLPCPAPVPTTAIYSKEDGIIPWQVCREQAEDHLHQNVRVHGSHLGFGVNPSVFYIIADRLQFQEENWQYFQPSDTLLGKFFFPREKTKTAI